MLILLEGLSPESSLLICFLSISTVLACILAPLIIDGIKNKRLRELCAKKQK